MYSVVVLNAQGVEAVAVDRFCILFFSISKMAQSLLC